MKSLTHRSHPYPNNEQNGQPSPQSHQKTRAVSIHVSIGHHQLRRQRRLGRGGGGRGGGGGGHRFLPRIAGHLPSALHEQSPLAARLCTYARSEMSRFAGAAALAEIDNFRGLHPVLALRSTSLLKPEAYGQESACLLLPSLLNPQCLADAFDGLAWRNRYPFQRPKLAGIVHTAHTAGTHGQRAVCR